ncbi:ATP-binding cassette domain-containing protein [Rhodopirellula sp. MGV]|uniref:ATP-binding cassette domain-containing protein n=1 Tax=Rhodopirellula sp. MGV TaxID=2023130 RepID=UPI002695F629
MGQLLSTHQLTKQYGKVTVLHEASFELRDGELHALLGANGAGKSTLCKMIAGLTSSTSGSMSLDGSSYRPANKQSAEAAGVQIIQQELNLIPTLSIAENLFLSCLPQAPESSGEMNSANNRRKHCHGWDSSILIRRYQYRSLASAKGRWSKSQPHWHANANF